MTTSFFFGKKSNFIQSSSKIYGQVNKNLSNIGRFKVEGKYYSFLNKKNLNSLKNYKFFVLLKSFGKNYVLFLTKIDEKNYCIFINKKNNVMNIVNIDFDDELFNGTLFDGEIVKNNENKYIFLINDLPYYKGNSLITNSFDERNKILENTLKDNYRLDNELYIVKKKYFKFKEINDLVDGYSKILSYRCSGLLFKNNTNFGDNYLFSFPECRSDSKILKNGVTIDNQKVIINEEHKIINTKQNINKQLNEDDELFGELENVNSVNSVNSEEMKNKKTCNFMINPTTLPDIYELYCYSSNNNIEKYAYASVPNIDTSNYIKSIVNFDNISENVLTKIKRNNATFVECEYHKVFKKWIPIKKVNEMDNVTIINQTQILLDSQ
jgi:hypothetical protein